MALVPIRTYGDGILIISGDSVRGQDAPAASGSAGSTLALRGGDGDGVGNAGGVTITGGAPGASVGAVGGSVTIQGTDSSAAGGGAGGDIILVPGLALGPGADGVVSIGNAAELTTGGNITLDSANPTFKAGDGTGTPSIELDKSDAGTSAVRWRNIGFTRWTAGLDTSEAWALGRFDGAAAFQDNPIVVSNATGNVTLVNNLTLNSTSPLVTFGDGTGSPGFVRDKSDGGQFLDRWRVAGNNRWVTTFATNEDLGWFRYNSSGVFQDVPLNLDASTGNVTLANNLTLNSASPIVTQGIGTGSPTYTFDKLDIGGASVIQFQFEGSLAANAKRILHDTDETFKIQHHDGGGFVDALTIDNNADVNVTNQLLIAGAAAGDADAGANDVIVGDQTGDAGFTINMGANTGEVAWNNGTNNRQAAITYVNASTRMDFRVGNVDELRLSGTVLGPRVTPGGLDLGTSGVPFGAANVQTLVIPETASVTDAPAAGFGSWWVRNTAPNTAMFQDDGLVDHSLTPGATGGNNTGLVGQRWGVGFINKVHANVLLIGDGVTATLGAEHFVNIVTPTLKSTAELPTAVVGDWYEIDLQDETSSADITPNTGDTINGGSAGVAKNITAAGLYTIYALDDTDWRLFGPLAVTA